MIGVKTVKAIFATHLDGMAAAGVEDIVLNTLGIARLIVKGGTTEIGNAAAYGDVGVDEHVGGIADVVGKPERCGVEPKGVGHKVGTIANVHEAEDVEQAGRDLESVVKAGVVEAVLGVVGVGKANLNAGLSIERMLLGEAAEDAVALAEIMIDAGGEEFAGVAAIAGEQVILATGDGAAGAIGIGVFGKHFDGDGIEATARNDVAGEEFAGANAVDEPAGGGVVDVDELGTSGGEEAGFRKIAGTFQRGGDAGDAANGVRFTAAFEGSEEERFILAVVEPWDKDGTTCGEAVLMTTEDGAWRAKAIVDEAVCVEKIVLMIVVGGAVKLVASGLGDDVDYAATCSAEFGGEAVGFHTELLDGIGRRAEGDTVEIADGVDCAIQENFIGGSAATADGEIGIEDAAAATGIADLTFGNDAGSKAHDGHYIALDQRKIVDGLGIDGGADVSGFGLKDGAFFGDLNFCCEAGDGESEIERGGLVDSKDHLLLKLLLKAGGGDCNFIGAGLKRGKSVSSVVVGDGGLCGVGIGFGDGDGGPGDGPIGWIDHGSTEARGEGLGV